VHAQAAAEQKKEEAKERTLPRLTPDANARPSMARTDYQSHQSSPSGPHAAGGGSRAAAPMYTKKPQGVAVAGNGILKTKRRSTLRGTGRSISQDAETSGSTDRPRAPRRVSKRRRTARIYYPEQFCLVGGNNR